MDVVISCSGACMEFKVVEITVWVWEIGNEKLEWFCCSSDWFWVRFCVCEYCCDSWVSKGELIIRSSGDDVEADDGWVLLFSLIFDFFSFLIVVTVEEKAPLRFLPSVGGGILSIKYDLQQAFLDFNEI